MIFIVALFSFLCFIIFFEMTKILNTFANAENEKIIVFSA